MLHSSPNSLLHGRNGCSLRLKSKGFSVVSGRLQNLHTEPLGLCLQKKPLLPELVREGVSPLTDEAQLRSPSKFAMLAAAVSPLGLTWGGLDRRAEIASVGAMNQQPVTMTP